MWIDLFSAVLSLIWRSSSTSVAAQVWRVTYTAWYETDQWKAQCKADAQSKIVKTWADLESRLCWSDKWGVMTLIHSPSMKSKSCDMHSLWEFKHTIDELWGSWWSGWWSKVEADNLDPDKLAVLKKLTHFAKCHTVFFWYVWQFVEW